MQIIDFHTHIFPDKIARQALATLAEDSGEYQPRTDGTLTGLLASMDLARIDRAVAANIATRPSQMLPIFDFSRHIAGPRIVPLISVHPDNAMNEVNALFAQAADAGIRGVKPHPMYQGFFIDDRKMYPLYQLIEHFGFFVVFHTGYDIAFPGNTQADVERVQAVLDSGARLVTLTGPGGVGKTRLALEVTRLAAGSYAHGVAFISLEALERAGQVFNDLRSRALGGGGARRIGPCPGPVRVHLRAWTLVSHAAA